MHVPTLVVPLGELYLAGAAPCTAPASREVPKERFALEVHKKKSPFSLQGHWEARSTSEAVLL
jgi:hypothetical protein